jgi:hypothetical protein
MKKLYYRTRVFRKLLGFIVVASPVELPKIILPPNTPIYLPPPPPEVIDVVPPSPTVYDAVISEEVILEYPKIYNKNVFLDDFVVDENSDEDIIEAIPPVFPQPRTRFPITARLKPPPLIEKSINHRGEMY